MNHVSKIKTKSNKKPFKYTRESVIRVRKPRKTRTQMDEEGGAGHRFQVEHVRSSETKENLHNKTGNTRSSNGRPEAGNQRYENCT